MTRPLHNLGGFCPTDDVQLGKLGNRLFLTI
jgi:hypothetical protein